MQTQVKEWGNSQGIRLPKEVLKSAGITLNEVLDVTIFPSPHPCEYGSSPLIKPCSSSSPMKIDYFHLVLACGNLS